MLGHGAAERVVPAAARDVADRQVVGRGVEHVGAQPVRGGAAERDTVAQQQQARRRCVRGGAAQRKLEDEAVRLVQRTLVPKGKVAGRVGGEGEWREVAGWWRRLEA